MGSVPGTALVCKLRSQFNVKAADGLGATGRPIPPADESEDGAEQLRPGGQCLMSRKAPQHPS